MDTVHWVSGVKDLLLLLFLPNPLVVLSEPSRRKPELPQCNLRALLFVMIHPRLKLSFLLEL
jgi:hypothetical protein